MLIIKKNNIFNKTIWFRLVISLLPLLIILIGTVPAVTAIIKPGYFTMHDALQAMRQLEMSKCFQDLQIPCRWVPDLGFGYGYPLFNYYPPMPYYLGEVFHLIGFSILDTIKIICIFAFLLSAFAMYFLSKEFWGKVGGIISALFYVWAPYHATDIYVRGAVNEAWALVWFPLILLMIYKVIISHKWLYIASLAFSSAMLMLSHNPMLMVFVPGAAIWALFWIWREKRLKSIFQLLTAAIWALSLAAFFTIPVIFEQKFAHVDTMLSGYFNYLAHFATLKQLFITVNWGYGASLYGPQDDMSFHLGYLHWVITAISPFIAIWIYKKNKTLSYLILFFFFWSLLYTFLSHERSTPIWKFFSILKYMQFPWRFLALSIFGMSFLAGSVNLVFSKLGKFKFVLVSLLITVLIFINHSYFSWGKYLPDVNDENYFSGDPWQVQITAGIFDYLPIWAQMPPAEPPKGDAEFLNGKGVYETIKKSTNFQEYLVTTQSDSSIFQINTFYFPGWNVFVNGNKISIDPGKDKLLGRIIINLERGNSRVTLRFGETPVRLLSDWFSLVGWSAFIIFFAYVFSRRLKSLKKMHDCSRFKE